MPDQKYLQSCMTSPSENEGMVKHRLLLRAFQDLDQAGICFCLLRGLQELALDAPEIEVDIFVDPRRLKAFEKTVAGLGFVSRPSWGHGSHHFFVAYDRAGDTWLKLDVVTDLVYGRRLRYIRLDSARAYLTRRMRLGPLYVLSVADEFMSLLLHAMLDKNRIAGHHRRRLKDLTRLIRENLQAEALVAAYCRKYLPSVMGWHAVGRAVDREDWSFFAEQRRATAKKLFWQHPLTNSWRWLWVRVAGRLRPLLFVLSHHGISVALLSPDGAGKSTLAEELGKIKHLRARTIYMGENIEAGRVGLPTSSWLKQQVKLCKQTGWDPKRAVYKVVKFSNLVVEQWYRYAVGLFHKMLGRFVIFDRYIYDAYLSPPAKTWLRRIRRWLLSHLCPKPDVVLLLDAPGAVLYERKLEHSPELLEKHRRIFLNLKGKITNLIVVDATRSAEEVRCEVVDIIWKYYGQHSGRYN